MTRRSFLRLLAAATIAAPSLIRSRAPAPARAYGDFSGTKPKGRRWTFEHNGDIHHYTPVFY